MIEDSLFHSILGGLISAGIITFFLYLLETRKKKKQKKLAYQELIQGSSSLEANFVGVLQNISNQHKDSVKQGQELRLYAIERVCKVISDTLHFNNDVLDSQLIYELRHLMDNITDSKSLLFDPSKFSAIKYVLDNMISTQIKYLQNTINLFYKIRKKLIIFDFKLMRNSDEISRKNYLDFYKITSGKPQIFLTDFQSIRWIIDNKGTYWVELDLRNMKNELIQKIFHYYHLRKVKIIPNRA